MAAASSSLSLKEYLKRYESGATTDDQKTRKKRKKEKPASKTIGGIRVVDEDPVWQKEIQIEEEPDSADEEKPQIDEDVEVKRMKRLEALRARKPYHAISEDGSGWVSISDSKKPSDSGSRANDLSPPRKGRARFDTPSPEPNNKPAEIGEADLSPPRQRRRRADTPSPEPVGKLAAGEPNETSPRKPRRQTGDISPQRRQVRLGSTPADDLSPPRITRKDPSESDDLSPPRRRSARAEENVDIPRRGGKVSSEDISPPRRPRPNSNDAHGSYGNSVSDLSPPRKKRNEVKETQKAGLFTGKEMKEEIERKKKEDMKRYSSMDAAASGKGAAPVFRDKEGKLISQEEIMKANKEEKPKEKRLEWGKGLAQKRQAEERASELELEKEKPFARTRDDPDLDNMLKERIRWGDPMAHLVKRKDLDPVLEDLGDDEKMKESGFIIPQSIPSHSWLKRGIDFPLNRFGIKPGRHWDGVDRSNGFEKEHFKRQNDKRATQQEAYLWSVSEM